MEKNLLQKLSEKFGKNCHNVTIKIVKGVTALMVATAIATSSLTSCTLLPETPGITDDGNLDGTKLEDKPYFELQDFFYGLDGSLRDMILARKDFTDENVEKISAVAKTMFFDEEIYENWKKEKASRGVSRPIPYTFLEKQGFDVEAIKTGKLNAGGVCYIKPAEPNILYLDTWAETTKGGINHYEYFTLKYKVTNQEIQEMEELFYDNVRYDGHSFVHDEAGYQDAGLYIQALDKTRPSTRVENNAVKMETKSADLLLKYTGFNTEKSIDHVIFQGHIYGRMVLSIDIENQKLFEKVFVVSINNRSTGNGYIYYPDDFSFEDDISSDDTGRWFVAQVDASWQGDILTWKATPQIPSYDSGEPIKKIMYEKVTLFGMEENVKTKMYIMSNALHEKAQNYLDSSLTK